MLDGFLTFKLKHHILGPTDKIKTENKVEHKQGHSESNPLIRISYMAEQYPH